MSSRKRTLTVRLQQDWRGGIRAAVRKGFSAKTYQGETLSFATPEQFFGKLSDKRWAIVQAMQGRGVLTTRAIARRVERDVKRVHEDVTALLELGLVERGDDGGFTCPFDQIHVDMTLKAKAA